MEEHQTPDWLASLNPQPEEDEEARDEGEKRGMVNRLIDSIRGRGRTDVVEDLREQIVPDEELRARTRRAPGRRFLNLKPQQLFVLSVLLFLEVAVCGVMALLFTGRIMP